jgi:hypothetical protein
MAAVHDTIRDVLEILRTNLESALNALDFTPSSVEDNVVLGNIAYADHDRGAGLADRLVLTLLKTEEEASLKNMPAQRRNPVTGTLEYVNPPVFLNLYVLVTANHRIYTNAMLFLSRAIGYFQYKKVFTEQDSAIPSSPNFQIERFNFNLSLLSPSFEQINHIWGVLGGKHLPFALYKLQLVGIEYRDAVLPGQLIEEIVVGEKIYA